jgi:molybdopterin converting factor small subunit
MTLGIVIIVRYLAVLKGLSDAPEKKVHLNGKTLADLMAHLDRSERDTLKSRLFVNGVIRPDVITFINDVESSLIGGMGAKLKEGDEVTFLPSVHGG